MQQSLFSSTEYVTSDTQFDVADWLMSVLEDASTGGDPSKPFHLLVCSHSQVAEARRKLPGYNIVNVDFAVNHTERLITTLALPKCVGVIYYGDCADPAGVSMTAEVLRINRYWLIEDTLVMV